MRKVYKTIMPIILPAIAGIVTILCNMYCAFWWLPAQTQLTWLVTDSAVVCGVYCATALPVWAFISIGVGLLSIVSGIMLKKSEQWKYVLIITGILMFPIGLLNLYVVWRRR